MFRAFANMFRIPELRARVIFTLAMMAVCCAGDHVPLPGVDGSVLTEWFSQETQKNSRFFLGFFDAFSGGALQRAAVFALNIMPYISASIIIQLLTVVVPHLEKLAKEEQGRRKINQFTRYGTVLIGIVQGSGISMWLSHMPAVRVTLADGMVRTLPIVPHPGIWFHLQCVTTLVAATVFLMWVGEQITERGIGNGTSIVIFANVIAAWPIACVQIIEHLRESAWVLVVLIALFVFVVGSIIYITQAQRRIPIQYPKRVVGNRVFQGRGTHIPLRLNAAGVIPIIFAQSIIMFPATMLRWIENDTVTSIIDRHLSSGAFMYMLLTGLMIMFFSYFYTAVIFNPKDVAENMKKHGGLVPGYRPGAQTAKFFDFVMSRITLAGSFFLVVIALLPSMVAGWLGLSYAASMMFGGTGLLIVVGVALDTMRQVESHLHMRQYEGFMKKGKLRGRR